MPLSWLCVFQEDTETEAMAAGTVVHAALEAELTKVALPLNCMHAVDA